MTDSQKMIVVGVDGSPSSNRALTWALAQAGVTGATVHAVTAWEYPNLYGGYPGTQSMDWAANARLTLDTALSASLGKQSADVVSAVVEGHPAKVLLDAAAQAELLVVGSRGHGGFVEMLLGSVAQHLVAHAACPVLVVRA